MGDTKVPHKQAADSPDWPDAFYVFGQIFQRVRENPGPAILFVVIYTILAALSVQTIKESSPLALQIFGYESLATLVFLLALPIYGLALADNKKITLQHFLRFNIRTYLSLLAVGLLTVLIVSVSLLALIVPVIWAIGWFFAGTYAAVDKRLGPIEALKESKRISAPHIGKVWGIVGVSILLSVVCLVLQALPFVGLFLSIVAYGLLSVVDYGAGAYLYRWLQDEARETEQR